MNPRRHAARLLTLGIALSCLVAPLVGHAQRHFTVIDAPGANGTSVTSLNNLGQVVGTYQNGNLTQSFVWCNGKFTNVPAPSGVQDLTVSSINDLDIIVGGQVSTDFSQGGFFYEWGLFGHLDNPNAVIGLTFPQSINDLGQVAGFFVDSSFNTSGFVYQGGRFKTVKVPFAGAITTSINAINNLGEVAGSYFASTPDGSFSTKAFVSANGKFTSLSVPGAVFSIATGINDLGQVVGYYEGNDFVTHGFLYEKGRYTTLDAPVMGCQGTYPGGINDFGQISGEYLDSSFQEHGFLFN